MQPLTRPWRLKRTAKWDWTTATGNHNQKNGNRTGIWATKFQNGIYALHLSSPLPPQYPSYSVSPYWQLNTSPQFFLLSAALNWLLKLNCTIPCVGSITSRCSGKEPALLPWRHVLFGEGRGPGTRERRKSSLYHVLFDCYLLLEPFHGLFLRYLVRGTNMSFSSPSLCHIESWAAKYNIEIHSINTNSWVILDTKINMFLDSKPKVSWNNKNVSLIKDIIYTFPLI